MSLKNKKCLNKKTINVTCGTPWTGLRFVYPGSQKGEGRGEIKKIHEEIMVLNFPKLMETINTQIEKETEREPDKVTSKSNY